MHVIKAPKQYSFEKVGIKGKIFPTDKLTDKTEYFLVETENGHETEIIEHKCDFIYYILSGYGSFLINGQQEKCQPVDLVVIPMGCRFSYKGKLKMIATSTPPWFEEQEETL